MKPTLRIAKLSEIEQDPNNANRHTERGRNMVERSLRERGFFRPMAAAGKGVKQPVMLAGNLTQETAAAIGMDEAIIVETDGSRPIVHVRTDLEPGSTQAILLGLEDNRSAEVSLNLDPAILQGFSTKVDLKPLWNDEELQEQFKQIPLNGSAEVEDVEPQIDKAEELREKWGVESGQLWQLGEHRLLCGDSTKREDVDRLMTGEQAVLCHADPPYGMGKESEGVENDNLYGPKLDAFQMAWWAAIRPSLLNNASVYIWGNAEDLWRLWHVGGLQASERLTFRNEIVWNKGNGQGIQSQDFRSYPPVTERCLFFMLGEQGFNNNADNYWEGWEPIQKYLYEQRKLMGWTSQQMKEFAGWAPNGHGDHWTGKSQWMMPTRENYEGWQRAAKNDAFKREYDTIKREYDDLKRDWYATRAYFDNTHDSMTDVWDFPRVTGEERWDHATPKPVNMIGRAIKSSAPDGAIVLDPFSGSGSTLIACEQLGRKCRAIEIAPPYVAVALERWSTATGKQPQLLS